MYISQLVLNPCNHQVRAELSRAYEMHRTLLNAFPHGKVKVERDTDDAAGVLYRVDESPRDQRIVVLVQSRIAPDWSSLAAKRDAHGHAYLLRPPEPKSFEPKLAAGQMLAFRLRANPTKRLGKSAGSDYHKRVGIYEEDEQLNWLSRKAELGGFSIERVTTSRAEKIEDKPRSEDMRPALELLSIQFDGVLQVVDATRLHETIARGIGSGKAFGFGLLSLAPLR